MFIKIRPKNDSSEEPSKPTHMFECASYAHRVFRPFDKRDPASDTALYIYAIEGEPEGLGINNFPSELWLIKIVRAIQPGTTVHIEEYLPFQQIFLKNATVYVMNDEGKTVDTLYSY